jgi:hypothetical protein
MPDRPSARRSTRALAAAAFFVACALATTRAADPSIDAVWRSASLVVDGSTDDWPSLQRIDDGPMVGVANDDRAVYLAVASNDPTVRRQLATGLVVWLDATDEEAQTFGVRLEGLAPEPLPGATPTADVGDALGTTSAAHALESFDLLGPGKSQRRLIEQTDAIGIGLASGMADRAVAYELKLPLAKSETTPYAVGARPGATILVGLETPAEPKVRRRNRLDNPMSTDPYVIDPYGGYFRPPPTNSGSKPRKADKVEPMKLVWVQVHLASAH